MNTKLRRLIPQLDEWLKDDMVSSFIVGITEDVDARGESYSNYQLFLIAEGDQRSIVQAECDLIDYYVSHTSLKDKCENERSAAGTGQVQDVRQLYIAVQYHDAPLGVHHIMFSDIKPIEL